MNLILGAATGYSWEKMAYFVRSCRRACPDAEIVLLTADPDETVQAKLADFRVRTVKSKPPFTWLPPYVSRQRFNRRRFDWAHRAIMRPLAHLPASIAMRAEAMARVANYFHHPMCTRFFQYYRFLRKQAGKYDGVLLTDVRDVIFQSDPFANPHSTGLVFLEHAAKHGSHWGNDNWIEIGFGAEGKKQLAGQRVVCAGTTLGPADAMTDYVQQMTWQLAQRTDRLAGLDGVDQGVHNWLFWTGRLPRFTAVENFAGPVLTMHEMPDELIQFGPNDTVVDPFGHTIPVLHQYDRHPEIADRLLRKITS